MQREEYLTILPLPLWVDGISKAARFILEIANWVQSLFPFPPHLVPLSSEYVNLIPRPQVLWPNAAPFACRAPLSSD